MFEEHYYHDFSNEKHNSQLSLESFIYKSQAEMNQNVSFVNYGFWH